MAVVHWTKSEDLIIAEELAGGRKGWAERSVERLPDRSISAVKKRGDALYPSRSFFPHPKGKKPFPPAVVPESRAPLADRVPAFLTDEFRRFGVPV